MTKKIIIKQDKNSEMLDITTDDGKCLFYGNDLDFNRQGINFKSLFEKIGLEVEIIDKDMSNG